MNGSDEYMVPSTFCRHSEEELRFELVPIVGKRAWVTQVRVPFHLKAQEAFDAIRSRSSRFLLFDGCSTQLKNLLNEIGFNSYLVGREAVLDLDEEHFSKKSLRALVKRGLRHGCVKEIEYSETSRARLDEFRLRSPIGKSPQLRYLFCTTLEKHTRLFVFVGRDDEWLGLVTLSHRTDDFMQTELILRRANNPVGIMEALVWEVFAALKREEKKYWSLGSVPYVVPIPFSLSTEWLINFIGRRLRFAYNYEGLFTFKNKFMPVWKDYYICFEQRLTPLQLFDLMRKTKLLSLVVKKICWKVWRGG